MKGESAVTIMNRSRKDGLISPKPFQEPISFDEFDSGTITGEPRSTGRSWGALTSYNGTETTNFFACELESNRQAADLRAAHARPL